MKLTWNPTHRHAGKTILTCKESDRFAITKCMNIGTWELVAIKPGQVLSHYTDASEVHIDWNESLIPLKKRLEQIMDMPKAQRNKISWEGGRVQETHEPEDDEPVRWLDLDSAEARCLGDTCD